MDIVLLMVQNIFSEEDWSQNYLVIEPVLKYFKPIRNNVVMVWKSRGLSDETIKPLTITGNSLVPRPDYFNNPRFWVKFDGSWLKPDRVTFTPKKITNLLLLSK